MLAHLIAGTTPSESMTIEWHIPSTASNDAATFTRISDDLPYIVFNKRGMEGRSGTRRRTLKVGIILQEGVSGGHVAAFWRFLNGFHRLLLRFEAGGGLEHARKPLQLLHSVEPTDP